MLTEVEVVMEAVNHLRAGGTVLLVGHHEPKIMKEAIENLLTTEGVHVSAYSQWSTQFSTGGRLHVSSHRWQGRLRGISGHCYAEGANNEWEKVPHPFVVVPRPTEDDMRMTLYERLIQDNEIV